MNVSNKQVKNLRMRNTVTLRTTPMALTNHTLPTECSNAAVQLHAWYNMWKSQVENEHYSSVCGLI